MKARWLSLLTGSLIVLLAILFAGAALITQPAAAQPITPFGAHPMQDHWGQMASGAGNGTRWTSSTATAITGITTAAGPTIGVLGRSRNGYGVYGSATNTVAANVGVYGETASERGRGVRGFASDTTGYGIGVDGISNSPGGAGVYGQGQRGVYGYSNAAHGIGVLGFAVTEDSGWGVWGSSSSYEGIGGLFVASEPGNYMNTGVYAAANGQHGIGVEAHANATDGDRNVGVLAAVNNNNGYGVLAAQSGYSVNDISSAYYESGVIGGGWNGVIGFSKQAGGFGVFGHASGTGGMGVRGTTTSADGWSGSFYSGYGNGVSISTPAGKVGLTVAGGTKNAVVATADGARLLYAEEATSVWFTDYGFGVLKNGAALVTIDPIYAQTVDLTTPYHVFLEPYAAAALYVAERTPTSFTVRLHDGDAGAEFSYRIVGRRVGYEDDRLERAPASDSDPNLFAVTANQGATLQRPERAVTDPATMTRGAMAEIPPVNMLPASPPPLEDFPNAAPAEPAPHLPVTAPIVPAPLPAGVHQLFAPALGK